MKDGFLDRHVPTIRALYKSQRDAMLAALKREMAGLDVQWNTPGGGMFLWARLPAGHERRRPAAQGRGQGRGLRARRGRSTPATRDPRTLRLSFVTASVEQINTGDRRAGADRPRGDGAAATAAAL